MIDKISEEWLLRGFTCDLWIDPPGHCWAGYKHKKDELFMLLEGSVEIELDGKTLRPEIHEVILIPAHTLHTVCNIGNTESRWLYGIQMRNINTTSMKDFNR